MYVKFSAAEQSEVWDRFEAGESMRSFARSIGRSQGAVRDLILKTGGIRPVSVPEVGQKHGRRGATSQSTSVRSRRRARVCIVTK